MGGMEYAMRNLSLSSDFIMSLSKPTNPGANSLYFGNGLEVLREHIQDESAESSL